MRQKYFIDAFADGGDRTPVVPNAADPSGFVSYSIGFTFDYQRNLDTDPAAKSPTRINFNSVLYDTTLNIQQYQQNGAPEWIRSADNGGSSFAYAKGAVVLYSAGGTPPFQLYYSIIDANTDTPGATANWINLSHLYDGTSSVLSFNSRFGVVTLTRADVSTALGYAPAAGLSQTFVATGPFTVPAGITKLDVEVWGAGGGSGAVYGGVTENCGSSGSGGGYSRGTLTGLTPGAIITATIGAGGTGGTVAGTVAPTAGGSSSFGAITATGGGAGVNGTGGGPGGLGGAGGSGSGGYFAATGQQGATFILIGSANAVALAGGGGTFAFPTPITATADAAGGFQPWPATAGRPALTHTATDYDGGSGTDGLIVVRW